MILVMPQGLYERGTVFTTSKHFEKEIPGSQNDRCRRKTSSEKSADYLMSGL